MDVEERDRFYICTTHSPLSLVDTLFIFLSIDDTRGSCIPSIIDAALRLPLIVLVVVGVIVLERVMATRYVDTIV